MNPTDLVDRASLRDDIPAFAPGDTVKVHVKVVEGNKQRVQVFQGVVIRRQGDGLRESFTVRKVSYGVGVERTFPVHTPTVERIEVVTRGDVRRAKLYYLRDRVGKAAKIKEKRAGLARRQRPVVEPLSADRGRLARILSDALMADGRRWGTCDRDHGRGIRAGAGCCRAPVLLARRPLGRLAAQGPRRRRRSTSPRGRWSPSSRSATASSSRASPTGSTTRAAATSSCSTRPRRDAGRSGVHRASSARCSRAWGSRRPDETELIKRVDRAARARWSQARGGRVLINGRELVEPYLPPDVATADFGPVIVPADDVFVLGDNRGNSADSRGRSAPCPRTDIVGRAIARVWPPGRWANL